MALMVHDSFQAEMIFGYPDDAIRAITVTPL